MNISSGTILISAPSLEDPNFDKAVLFIAEHNEKGAMGFVLNKRFSRTFNELVEFKNTAAFPLFEGGPVETESLFFLHRRPDLIEDGTFISNSIYLGGNFKQAVAYITDKQLQQNDIKLLIGYCGWDYNQLEEEVKEGSWLIRNVNTETVFSIDTTKLWEELY